MLGLKTIGAILSAITRSGRDRQLEETTPEPIPTPEPGTTRRQEVIQAATTSVLQRLSAVGWNPGEGDISQAKLRELVDFCPNSFAGLVRFALEDGIREPRIEPNMEELASADGVVRYKLHAIGWNEGARITQVYLRRLAEETPGALAQLLEAALYASDMAENELAAKLEPARTTGALEDRARASAVLKSTPTALDPMGTLHLEELVASILEILRANHGGQAFRALEELLAEIRDTLEVTKNTAIDIETILGGKPERPELSSHLLELLGEEPAGGRPAIDEIAIRLGQLLTAQGIDLHRDEYTPRRLDPPPALADMPISATSLPTRIQNLLGAGKIRTVADLLETPQEKLLALRGMGFQTRRAIERWAHENDIPLARFPE